MQHKRNRKVFKSTIATVELCGCQGITPEMMESTLQTPIIIVVTSKFRCDVSDTALAEHRSKCARNASHHSKTTQNDIIEILGGMLTETILREVNEARFFAVITDKVQYATSKSEQFLC